MEKTSIEYAEKMFSEHCRTHDNEKAYIEGYMKAVEETNTKELREALEDLINLHKDAILNNGGQPQIQKAINAINKATK